MELPERNPNQHQELSVQTVPYITHDALAQFRHEIAVSEVEETSQQIA